MSKTPYELRFDILQMAREIVERSYDEKYNMAWSYINDCMEKGKELTKQKFDELAPNPISADEIKAKARELYEFVETK